MSSRTLIRWYWTEYPPRTVVFPAPNHGTCHAKPTAGPKLFVSFGYQPVLELGEFFPTNCMTVGSPRTPGFIQSAKLLPDTPKIRLGPPTGRSIKPLLS